MHGSFLDTNGSYSTAHPGSPPTSLTPLKFTATAPNTHTLLLVIVAKCCVTMCNMQAPVHRFVRSGQQSMNPQRPCCNQLVIDYATCYD